MVILLNVRAVVVDLCTVISGIPQRFYPAAVCTLIFRPPLLVSGGDNNINGHADFSRGVVNRQIIGVSVLVQTAELQRSARRCDQHISSVGSGPLYTERFSFWEADRKSSPVSSSADDRSPQIKAMNDLNDLVFDFPRIKRRQAYPASFKTPVDQAIILMFSPILSVSSRARSLSSFTPFAQWRIQSESCKSPQLPADCLRFGVGFTR